MAKAVVDKVQMMAEGGVGGNDGHGGVGGRGVNGKNAGFGGVVSCFFR